MAARYITWKSVVDRYKETSTSVDEATMLGYIEGAEAEVDARLSVRYTTPFTSTIPELVKDIVKDMVYCKVRRYSKECEGVANRVETLLKALANGSMSLGTETGTGNMTFVSETYRTAFGPDDADNWSPDQDKLDDADADRS